MLSTDYHLFIKKHWKKHSWGPIIKVWSPWSAFKVCRDYTKREFLPPSQWEQHREWARVIWNVNGLLRAAELHKSLELETEAFRNNENCRSTQGEAHMWPWLGRWRELSTSWKAGGSIPDSSSLHIELSLGKYWLLSFFWSVSWVKRAQA